MGVCSGQFAGKGGANTNSTVAVLFHVVTAVSFCTPVPVNRNNRQLV